MCVLPEAAERAEGVLVLLKSFDLLSSLGTAEMLGPHLSTGNAEQELT